MNHTLYSVAIAVYCMLYILKAVLTSNMQAVCTQYISFAHVSQVSMGSEDIDMFMEFALDIGNRAKAINLFPTKGWSVW